jgi:hypothetical protein
VNVNEQMHRLVAAIMAVDRKGALTPRMAGYLALELSIRIEAMPMKARHYLADAGLEFSEGELVLDPDHDLHRELRQLRMVRDGFKPEEAD